MQLLAGRALLSFIFVVFVYSSVYAFGRKDFSSYGPGVAAAGYGDAGTSFARDISAYYFNPSLLSGFKYVSASASHFILYEGANYSYLALGYPLKNSFSGLSFVQLDSGQIELMQNIQDEPKTASARQYLITLSYAMPLFEEQNLS